MNPLGGARAIVGADGDGGVDWNAAREAARSLTKSGDLDLEQTGKEGYAGDIRAARREIRDVAGIDFELPPTVEVQNRHHWIDGTLGTLESAFEPLADGSSRFPQLTGPFNTASVAGSVAYLSRQVLGQYDPLLFAEGDAHDLYIVHPNVVAAATELSVDFDRFRRWIAFHEVAHAAEFGTAPWLRSYLADRVTGVVAGLANGSVPRQQYGELNRAMTAVEGYAELLMDDAFDAEATDLRRKLDERRGSGGHLSRVISRVLGLDIKRAQYERGREFFEAIVAERGLERAGLVWADPSHLPQTAELASPGRWLDRVPPGESR